jgi:sugar fermentation stimulation protein A
MHQEGSGFLEAEFIARLNRFVGIVSLRGKRRKVYVPNTGRLSELLIPGRMVLLVPSPGKYSLKLLYVIYNESPVMIDSVYSNAIMDQLLKNAKIPGFEQSRIVKKEPAYGNHRFDFLLEYPGGRKSFLEVKSCTLAWNSIASFPDAVSSRAAEHIRQLSSTDSGSLIFFILHSGVQWFVPNYHTDFQFYQTLMKHRDTVRIHAFSAVYNGNKEIVGANKVPIILPRVNDRGSYLIVLECPEDVEIEVGSLGPIRFRSGFYVYSGSGMRNLFKRIERHRRGRKKRHWHIDYITGKMRIKADLPIVFKERLECRLAQFAAELGGEVISGFGASDCQCQGHLFYYTDNPMIDDRLWDGINEFRFGSVVSGAGSGLYQII